MRAKRKWIPAAMAAMLHIGATGAFATTEDIDGRYYVQGVPHGDLLNVRAGPGVHNAVILAISEGTAVDVLGDGAAVGNTIWYPIAYQGIKGWVNNQYLRRGESQQATPTRQDRQAVPLEQPVTGAVKATFLEMIDKIQCRYAFLRGPAVGHKSKWDIPSNLQDIRARLAVDPLVCHFDGARPLARDLHNLECEGYYFSAGQAVRVEGVDPEAGTFQIYARIDFGDGNEQMVALKTKPEFLSCEDPAVKARRVAEAERERELRAEAEAEQRRIQKESSADSYMSMIRQSIEANWVRPPGTERLRCSLEARLAPNGDVIGVRVLASSGDFDFDRSVMNAFHKAAPLPVPSGELFEQFRTVRFNFDPGGRR